MKDTYMKEPSGSGLLDHLHRLLDSLQPFNNAYLEYQRGDSGKLQSMQTAWAKLLPVCIEAGKATSRDTGELADWIRDAGRWCKRFSDAVNSHGFGDAVFNDQCDGIMAIVQSGWQLLGKHADNDEPFAFLQESGSKGNSSDAEPSIANPFQVLSAGNAAIADAQKAVSDALAAGKQALSNGEHSKADCRVESKFPKPDDSLTDDAIEYLKKSFHKLPHAGTAQATHVIAAAVKDGIQRNAVEWALVRMQEYGWIKLSIPVWGGVIGNHRSEPKYQAPVQERKPTRWYFGTQEYNLRLTEYFYNPSYCRTCSKLIGDYDYDRSECHDCRSPQGKLADLDVAIKCEHRYGNESDSPERIREWPTIRAYLRDRFGPDRTNMQLWEWMTDHLRVLGWNEERWLRMRYGEFIDLLKSGLLNERQRDVYQQTDGETEIEQPTTTVTDRKGSKSLEACEPAERKAYYSFKLAEAVAERRLEDREAYDLLIDGDLSEHFTGELADYKPPSFATWARQLRTTRKATNERKYTPRTHR